MVLLKMYEKSACFVRFENRVEIKWYIPISFFFVCGKCAGKPVNKGFSERFLQSEKSEVRY